MRPAQRALHVPHPELSKAPIPIVLYCKYSENPWSDSGRSKLYHTTVLKIISNFHISYL